MVDRYAESILGVFFGFCLAIFVSLFDYHFIAKFYIVLYLLNLAMLRRKLQTPDLCIELNRVGGRTNTAVFVCYLGTLVNRKTLKKIKKSLESIDIDGVLDTNYITEQISPHPFSLFKTAGKTERPDVVAARLLEGRIAIIVDGIGVYSDSFC